MAHGGKMSDIEVEKLPAEPLRGRILIVEDEMSSVELLSVLLHGAGLEILPAADAESGFRLALEEKPDLALLDVLLPGENGFQLCARLKLNPATRRLPVIFITALDDRASILKGFASGGLDYISKPINREELLARVGAQLRLGVLTKDLEAANSELEERVVSRTAELSAANDLLRREIEERRKVELALRKTSMENECLLHEVHDRVRNNLQVISSLAGITASGIVDPASRAFYAELAARIRAMAEVHEQLYSTGNFETIDIAAYVSRRARQVADDYRGLMGAVDIEEELEPLALGLDRAMPCCMLVNEILIDSFRYAFPHSPGYHGRIRVTVKKDGAAGARIELVDNGVGIRENAARGTGPLLIELLAAQLGATLAIDHSSGTRYQIAFPL
jgi:two-component sensor histidine kinase/FixJ family two-component response regulator